MPNNGNTKHSVVVLHISMKKREFNSAELDWQQQEGRITSVTKTQTLEE